MPKLSIRDLSLQGKRIFMRVDFNVPLSDVGEITDAMFTGSSFAHASDAKSFGQIYILGIESQAIISDREQ